MKPTEEMVNLEAVESRLHTINKIVHVKTEPVERKLLDLDNFALYLSIGKTQARKILKSSDCPFSLKIGYRWYANKTILDKWIDEKTTKIR